MSIDLAMVMPVYNEEACIADVIDAWCTLLTELDIRFQLIVINDGSRDGTAEALAPFKEDRQIHIVNKQNSGHGPSILMGYHLAVQAAEWVFQCDSDDEISADYFRDLWVRRNEFAALFGTRTDRKQCASRKLITIGSRLAVRLRYGQGVSDVNTPYRLMRADLLNQIIRQIPADTFAPNVIISGVLAKSGVPIYEYPVRHVSRQTSVNSLRNLKLWNSAVKSLWQLIRCCPVINYPMRAGQN